MIDIFLPIENNENNDDTKLANCLIHLKNQGIDEFVASLKISTSLFQDSFFKKYTKLLDSLRIKSGVKIHYGPLIKFSTASEFAQLKDSIVISGTRYINTELSMKATWRTNYINSLYDFMQNTGAVCIICGVEKYPAIKKQKKYLKKLADIGCVFSVSLESFSNKKHKKMIKKINNLGLCDLIVTGTSPDKLEDKNIETLFSNAEKVLGKEKFNTCMSNSQRVLKDFSVIRATSKSGQEPRKIFSVTE